MNDITLLIMAAGMGSRYGGLKQLDRIGKHGETIIDYSLFDAIRSGFTKVVFIIRKQFEREFKLRITNKFSRKIKIEFAFQEINDLPEGFHSPADRKKPWGTGHAILAARNIISEPFVVINGDDFYGLESYNTIVDYYRNGGKNFSMVAFQLNKTLSEFGGVSRGLCEIRNKLLHTVIETEDLQSFGDKVIAKNKVIFSGNEPVSMNVWGFTPKLFPRLETKFVDFLKKYGTEPKSEFLIPSVVNDLIQESGEKVKVLKSNESWFGVTYKKDKPIVAQKIINLIEKGDYPENMF